VSTVDLFFGAATFGFTESNFSAETLLCEFVGAKADLLAERMLSLVWQVHVVSVALLKVRIVSSFSAALFVPSGF
ncbi:hypothetical protein, partial [Vibrio parahaemolyticus]